ncbi:unnamed protein product [Sphagnum balticum]
MIRLNNLRLVLNFASSNYFTNVQLAPPDPIIGTGIAYEADKSPDKINLGVGAYRDDNGKPYVFKVVKEIEDQIASTQALSGTGALSIGFAFLRQYLPRKIYISDPTWGNHKNMIEMVNLQWGEYPYYHPATRGFDFEGTRQFLEKVDSGSIILLHVCAHNPTGVDPTQDQWKVIAEIMKRRDLVPFFDSAYQGFASGCVDRDAWPVRYFVS